MTPTIPKLNYTFPALSEFPTVGDMNFSEKAKQSCDSMQGLMLTLAAFQPELNDVTDAIDDAAAWAEEKLTLVHNDMETAAQKAQDAAYYASRAEAATERSVGVLPMGTINDFVSAINTTYSSAKIEEMIGGIKLAPLSIVPVLEMTEGETIELFASQNDSYTYISASADIGTINIVDGKIRYTAPAIDADVTANITAYVAKIGYIRSQDATQPIIVRHMAIIQIAAKTLTEVTALASNVGFVTESGNIRASSATGIARSVAFDYAATPIKKSKLKYVCTPKRVGISAGTTATTLKTVDQLTTNETIIVANGTKTSRIQIAAVDGGQSDTVSTVDVFGDGSGISLWRFDNALADAAGAFNATDRAGTITYAAGKFANAAKFAAASWDAGIVCGTVDNRTTDRTLTLWFKISTNVTGHIWHSGNKHYYLYLDQGKLRATWKTASGANGYLYTDMNMNDGQWHHIALHMRGDHQYIEMRIDNVKTFSSAISGGLAASALEFTGFGREYVGLIEQARYFSKKLTAAEIAQLYTEEGTAYVVDIANAGLTSAPTYVFRDLPTVHAVIGGDESSAAVTNVNLVGTSLQVQQAEYAKQGETLQFIYRAKNIGDVIDSVTCDLWSEG